MNMQGGSVKSKALSVEAEPEKAELKEPKVFIGIPTGPSKLYSTYYMVAALANLDYSNVEIHWAVTGGYDSKVFGDYKRRLTKLMEAVKWSDTVKWHVHYVPLDYKRRLTKLMEAVKWSDTVKWHVHYVPLSKKQRFTNYQPILQNKVVLRDAFLDGDAEYFMLCGGDNPPPRNSIKRLLRVGADVSIGVCYQRPNVDKRCGVYPLVWYYAWMPRELEKHRDLHPLVLEQLRLAWLHCPAMINLSFNPNWRRRKTVWNITGGDGCALIRRAVLEMVDWGVTPDNAYHSEDIHFMTLALWHGFTTAAATDLHIPHFDPDGVAY